MMRVVLFFCCLSCLLTAEIRVWIDTDPAAGLPNRDVDDGLALLQAFASKELKIIGISAVFGNTPLKNSYPIAQHMVKEFASYKIPVYQGAATANREKTPASQAIAAALRKQKMVILVLGPITNIATVIHHHPELHSQILEIIAVAGRRPGQRFQTGSVNTKAHRDLNFELDPSGFKEILATSIPLTLAPFEISSKVWITKKDINVLRQGGKGAKWIVPPAERWLKLWKDVFEVEGFNPFDTLAVGYLTNPQWLQQETLPAMIQILPDDGTEERMQGTKEKNKPYLLVDKSLPSTRTVRYCYNALPNFHPNLIQKLKNYQSLSPTSQKND